MNIRVITVGKLKEDYWKDGIAYYQKQIRKYHSLQIVEVKDEKTPDGASARVEEQIKQEEGKKILEQIQPDEYVIALCIEGKQCTSRKLASVLARTQDVTRKNVVFVIGGSLGLWEKVVQRADYRLSFSSMTFPHQLMRVMLLEQLTTIQSYL